MRPRSRHLAKRRLPTIREGHEELLQDMNQANLSRQVQGQDVPSSQDYLLSIRQLARPTFPIREQDPNILCLEAPKPGQRPPRRPTVPPRPPTPAARSGYQEKEEEEEAGSQHTVANSNGNGCQATSDPLEFLYGRWDSSARLAQDAEKGGARPGFFPLSRSRSFPHLPCSPRHTQRKSSCPEIRLLDAPVPAPSGSQPMRGSPEKKPGVPALSAEGNQETVGRCSPTGQRENCSDPADNRSMISCWIVDCRSAWQEARMRACMLPTIAEI